MKKSVLIIIAAAVFAVGFYGVRYVKKPVDVMTARAATKENKISAEGLIVYNESVYTAGTNGTFYSYAAEGERVGKERLVATVYDGVVDKEVLQSLNNIDKKIAELEEAGNESTIYYSDESSEQAVIEDAKDKIIDAVIEDEIIQIPSYKSKMESTTGIAGSSDVDAELTRLRAEKSRIEAGLNQNRKNINSGISGIYTTSLDGLEGVITPELVKQYTVADFKALAEPQDTVTGNRTVQQGEGVCKVVDNHIWYTACVISRENCANLKVGQSVQLRVQELPGEVVSAKISYISAEAEGADEYLVVVECERYLEGVFNIRKSEVEIILESFYGFEVPLYAIRVQDGKNGVMVRNGSSEVFKECTVLNRNDETGMVIISPSGTGDSLENGDLIVLGEK